MAPARPTAAQLEQLKEAFARNNGNFTAAARELGRPRTTLQHWWANFISEPPVNVEFPTFVIEGDEDEPIEDLIARQRKHFKRLTYRGPRNRKAQNMASA